MNLVAILFDGMKVARDTEDRTGQTIEVNMSGMANANSKTTMHTHI
jgi:hypothetical protein